MLIYFNDAFLCKGDVEKWDRHVILTVPINVLDWIEHMLPRTTYFLTRGYTEIEGDRFDLKVVDVNAGYLIEHKYCQVIDLLTKTLDEEMPAKLIVKCGDTSMHMLGDCY